MELFATAAIAVHIAISLLLLPFILLKKKYATRLLFLAICVNTVPFLFLPDIGMERLSETNIPFAYFPMISGGAALIMLNGGFIDKRDIKVMATGGIFIAYTFVVALYKGFSWTTLQYILMWVFNLSLFLTVSRLFSNLPQPDIQKIFRQLVWLILLATTIGVAKFLFGISKYANFMPLLNEAAVSFIVLGIWPLVFYLRDRKLIRNISFWGAQCLGFAFFMMLGIRAGFLSMMFINMIYFGRGLKFKRLVILIFVTSIAFSIYMTFEKRGAQRMAQVPDIIRIMLFEKDISGYREEYAQTFDRMMLIKGAIEIFKNEFWFGSGIGRENYQRAFNEYFPYYRQTKPHNLYVSALAEYGLVGSLLLFVFLYSIYKGTPRLRRRNGVLAISLIGIAFLMTMNEFIGMPDLWFITGMMVGSGRQLV